MYPMFMLEVAIGSRGRIEFEKMTGMNKFKSVTNTLCNALLLLQ